MTVVEVLRIGESVWVLPNGMVSLEMPVFDEGSGSVEVGDSYEMDPDEATRIGSELLHAARRARRLRGESV